MKDLFTISVAGILLWWVMIWPIDGDANPKIKEMVMKTETGEVVLSTEPCEFIKMGLKGYPYAAYATEKGKPHHEGCWKVDVVDRFSAVLVYFPEIDATAVYNPKLFSPREEPNVSLEPRLENNNAFMFLGFRF
jgi:hypothetical protein